MKRKYSATLVEPDDLKPSQYAHWHPLTKANLERLQSHLQSTMPPRPGSQSPSKKSASSTAASFPISSEADAIPRLRAYGIYVDSIERNPEIDAFAQRIQDSVRTFVSPNAKRIVARAGMIERTSEASGRRYLQDLLLVKPATPDTSDDDDDAIPRVWLGENSNLSRRFMPPPHADFSHYAALNQAVPDASLGYLTWQTATATSPAMPHAFTRDEDTALRLEYAVDKESHLPFLTAQYKSSSSGSTVLDAKPQSARDGAILCHVLHRLYTDAYPSVTPSPVSTCHLSVTTDMRTFAVYLHWSRPLPDGSAGMEFHMQNLVEGMLKKENDIAQLRQTVRNWVDWALEERVAAIKDALQAKTEARAKAKESNGSAALTPKWDGRPAGGLLSPSITSLSESQDAGGPAKKRRVD